MSETLRVAAVQLCVADGDKEKNLALHEAFVRKATAGGADLVSFQECGISGYSFLEELTRADLAALAEPVPEGPSTQRLIEMARAHGIAICAGLVEAGADGRIYNTFVSVSGEGLLNRFRKLHPFVHPELSPGSEFPTFEFNGWKLGTLICYDNNLVENLRLMRLQGVELLFAPHMTGAFDIPVAGMGRIALSVWENRASDPQTLQAEILGPKGKQWLLKWLPSRAYDNGIFVVFTNGIGKDGPEVRTGNSMVLDPHGRAIAATDAPHDAIIFADCARGELAVNLGAAHLNSRRPHLYGPLAEGDGIADQSSRGVRDALRKSAGVKL